jgi:hypothetical protein
MYLLASPRPSVLVMACFPATLMAQDNRDDPGKAYIVRPSQAQLICSRCFHSTASGPAGSNCSIFAVQTRTILAWSQLRFTIES